MVKKINIIALLSLLIFASCGQEEALNIGEFEYKGQAIDTTTALGQKVYEIREKYQSNIIYNWDLYLIGNGATAVPPKHDKVLDYIEFLEEIWLKPYYNEDFLRENLPREIILVGGAISYGETAGTNLSVPGQADSQYRILMGDVNAFSAEYDEETALEYKHRVERIAHHEFAHILNKRHEIPEEYGEISKGLYLRNTSHTSLDEQEAFRRGFARPYGASNLNEDFATMAELIASNSKEYIFERAFSESTIDVNNANNELITGELVGIESFDKIHKKYNIVIKYYQDLGVDIQRIGNEAHHDVKNKAS